MTLDTSKAPTTATTPGRVLSRRRAVATLSAFGGAAALAACGETPTSAPAKSSGPVTVRLMQNDSNTADRPEGSTRVALLEEFTKTNSQKIVVNLDDAQANTSNDKLKS